MTEGGIGEDVQKEEEEGDEEKGGGRRGSSVGGWSGGIRRGERQRWS
jgi:hypothetical protein